jgi:hypothetical protein
MFYKSCACFFWFLWLLSSWLLIFSFGFLFFLLLWFLGSMLYFFSLNTYYTLQPLIYIYIQYVYCIDTHPTYVLYRKISQKPMICWFSLSEQVLDVQVDSVQ